MEQVQLMRLDERIVVEDVVDQLFAQPKLIQIV